MNRKKNKKVIRKDLVKGKFTSIHYSILYDTNLSSTAFRILVSILADKESYVLTQGLIIKRFGFHKDTIKKALKNLEECGYLQRNTLRKGHFYILSEFGNLNHNDEELPIEKEKSSIDKQIEDKKIEYLISISDFITIGGEIIDSVNDIYTRCYDFYDFKRQINKIVLKKKNYYLKTAMKLTENLGSEYPKKIIKEYENWLKVKIFDENTLDFNYGKKWAYLKQMNRKFKTDYETKMQDWAEDGYGN